MDICLIPARSGSKRIKNKNIKFFFGKPIISYSINTAIKSRLFDKIIVSTNSSKVAKIARKFGAETPFLRPKEISNDSATDYEVIKHFVEYCKQNKIFINKLCYLYPVNPLLKLETLKKCNNKILKFNCQKVMTVAEFPYPIQRALTIKKNKYVTFLNKKFEKKKSQSLKIYYQDAAQCYWYNFKKISKFKNKLKTMAVKLNRYKVCDVDTIEDFEILKKLYLLK